MPSDPSKSNKEEKFMIKRYSVVRIYPMNHIKTGPYWLVSARSKKRNVNERKTFSSKKLAEEYAKGIEENMLKFGARIEVPKEKVVLAERYQGLTDKLSPLGRSVEDSADFYHEHLGQEIIKQAKPFIRDLMDQWEKFKKEDTTLSKKFLMDIRSYARFIKRTWGDLKPDEPKKNQIDHLLFAQPFLAFTTGIHSPHEIFF
jgi:phage-related tail protein